MTHLLDTNICSAHMRHHEAGRLNEAIALCQNIVEAHPNHADACHLLEVALQLRPNWGLAVWRRAWGRLLLGDFADGWRDHEARWLDEDLQLAQIRNLPGNLWRGEDLRI